MHILIGYGFHPDTTGRYIERSLGKDHQVTFVGTSQGERRGYSADVDLLSIFRHITPKPDLFIYIDSGHQSYLPYNIHLLDCPTAAYLIDVHVENKLRKPLAKLFDYVFIAQKNETVSYRNNDSQYVQWLPLACDPDITRSLRLKKKYEIGFIGNFKANAERHNILKKLSELFVINDYQKRYSSDEIAKIYSQSKIVFNHSMSNDINMRIFESLASGSFLLTNELSNGLSELFEEGKHFATYKSEEELLDKARYFLEHEAEREEIARAGYDLVRTKHTYDLRCREILEVVFNNYSGKSSPLRKQASKEVNIHYSYLYSMFRLVDPIFFLFNQARKNREGRSTILNHLLLAIMRRLYRG